MEAEISISFSDRWLRSNVDNLRASRQTELENVFPTHVVCEWLGNTESVAREHYLRVTEDHFHAAVHGALQIPRFLPARVAQTHRRDA